MVERTELSPSALSFRSVPQALERDKRNFSPKTLPKLEVHSDLSVDKKLPETENLFSQDWEIEASAQKPAVLDCANIQELAARALEKARIYVGSIDYKDPMVLLEMAEIARVAAGIVSGGGLVELSTFLASTALIKGVEFAAPMKWISQPLPQETISKTDRVKQIAKQALIHHVEKQVAGKIVGKFLDN